jgi:hypothetical protein
MIMLWGWMTKEHEFYSRREQTVELPCQIQLRGRISHLLSECKRPSAQRKAAGA